jgi:hypothetical protein
MEINDSQGANWPSAHTQTRRETMNLLPEAHRDALVRALHNVLSTDIAEVTYAQILDGVPLAEVANDRYSMHFVDWRHPVQQHTSLCPGVVEQTKAFRSSFDPRMLEFDSQVRAKIPILNNFLYLQY